MRSVDMVRARAMLANPPGAIVDSGGGRTYGALGALFLTAVVCIASYGFSNGPLESERAISEESAARVNFLRYI